MIRVSTYYVPMQVLGQVTPALQQPPFPTGISQVDKFRLSTLGRAAMSGLVAAAMAKEFPGKFILPFIIGTASAYAFGVVKTE